MTWHCTFQDLIH
ncbi:hypothetical protein F383_10776 [Gossypium arboreum]|uniref:Uncharacterized protein n=1 Tax=Gossypium arboreum TaxID=29729 RepID=A0A0B0PV72_GOSAR|nr:hypothetical protein F383_10776 [Gossypium arboreum]